MRLINSQAIGMDSWVLFLNRLHDFSLLSSNSFLHSFLKSKFTKKNLGTKKLKPKNMKIKNQFFLKNPLFYSKICKNVTVLFSKNLCSSQMHFCSINETCFGNSIKVGPEASAKFRPKPKFDSSTDLWGLFQKFSDLIFEVCSF